MDVCVLGMKNVFVGCWMCFKRIFWGENILVLIKVLIIIFGSGF